MPSQNSFEEKALKLYKQAASLGHAKSAVKLGIIYFNGLAGGGKGKDMAKDMKAGSGNKNSSSSSSSNEVTCTGSLQYVKAARLFKIAADLRDAHGRFLLAKMYQVYKPRLIYRRSN